MEKERRQLRQKEINIESRVRIEMYKHSIEVLQSKLNEEINKLPKDQKELQIMNIKQLINSLVRFLFFSFHFRMISQIYFFIFIFSFSFSLAFKHILQVSFVFL